MASPTHGRELEQTLGRTVKGEEGSLVFCSPRGCKESGMTERLNQQQEGSRMKTGQMKGGVSGLEILFFGHAVQLVES